MSTRDRSDAEPEPAPETGRGTDLGAVTTIVAAMAVLGIASAIGPALATVGAVLAIGLLLGSLSPLSSDSLVARAIGSCAFVGGLFVLGASIAVGRPGTAAGAVAVGATGYAVFVRDPRRVVVSRTVRDSTVAAVVVGGVLGAIVFGVLGTVAAILRTVLSLATSSPFTAFVTLLLCLLGTLVLLEVARSTLEPWLPDGVEIPSLVEWAVRVIELPTGVYYVLALVGVVLLTVNVSVAFERALAALGPVGTGVDWILRSGIVHLLVASVALVAICAQLGKALAPAVRLWLGSYPLRTLALSTGGGIVSAVVVLMIAFTTTVPVPTATGLGASFGLLVVTFLLVNGLSLAAATIGQSAATIRLAMLAIGVTALFATTVHAALQGLEALGVFAGVAVTILVWDLGETVQTMDRQLGDGVDTREVELAHATGSVLVGCVGVVVAVVAMYVLGNVSPPDERWQAVAPLALALAALVVLTLAIQREANPLSALRRTVRRAPRPADLRRMPDTYPLAFTLLCIAVGSLVLVALGFGHVVFFLAVFVIPFVLLFVLDTGFDSPHDRW